MTIPTLDLANDANDDWLKKANPDYRKSELAIHAKLAQQQTPAQQTKEVTDLAMPLFKPMPEPEQLQRMADLVREQGLAWAEAYQVVMSQ